MRNLAILALLLAVGGCKIEQPSSKQEPRYGVIDTVAVDGDTIYVEPVPPKMAAGETWYSSAPTEANHPEIPEGSAAKVAAVMTAEGITLPQVAAYLNTYGYDVVPRTAWIRAHWGKSLGADYHIFRPYFATADTMIEFQVRGNITGTWPADVVGADILPDGRVVYGPWSVLGWRGGGDGAGAIPGIAATGHDALLPGVAE